MDSKITSSPTNLEYSVSYCQSHNINVTGIYDYLAADIKYAPEVCALIHKVLSTKSKSRWGIVYFGINRICVPMSPKAYYDMLFQTFCESWKYSYVKNSVSQVSSRIKAAGEDKIDEVQIEIIKLRRRLKEMCTSASNDNTGPR